MKNHKNIYINRIKEKEKICTIIPIFKYEGLIIYLEENTGIFKR
ncbi:helicase [Acetivibrio mesophilus]|uniref:Helicase n=1 Tax=Acetivibrio mesophilus TaxID=2487273 RepID=A0A4Q0I5Y2_9FIRM|nr:helicase [Acetivibrio mesophilus]